MPFLVRFAGDTPHNVAHHTHEINNKIGALCSSSPYPAVGEQSQKGEWRFVDDLPQEVVLCKNCYRAKAKKENPLPARVQRELELLAKWDPKAAARQKERMMVKYG